jgi:hypothetical protein
MSSVDICDQYLLGPSEEEYLPGKIIGTISFVGNEKKEHAILKKKDDNYTLICENGHMSFDKTIEQLKLFANVPLFFPDWFMIKMTLNDGESYIYDKENGNTSVYARNFVEALKTVK